MSRFSTSLIAMGALTATLLVSGCSSEPEATSPAAKPATIKAAGPPKPRGLPVKAEVVTVGDVVDRVTAVGSLLADESVIIRPEMDGRIVALHITIIFGAFLTAFFDSPLGMLIILVVMKTGADLALHQVERQKLSKV